MAHADPPSGRAAPRYHSPAKWAAVRAAYLAGETAASVAQRMDVGVDALNRRAIKEGWTRKAQREAYGEGPWPDERGPDEKRPDDRGPNETGPVEGGSAEAAPATWGRPGEAIDPRRIQPMMRHFEMRSTQDREMWYEARRAPRDAMRRASRLAVEGKGAQARAVMETAKALMALEPEEPLNLAQAAAKGLEDFGRYVDTERWSAMALAIELVRSDAKVDGTIRWHRGFIFHRRRDVYGPELAALDRRDFAGAPWAADVWDAEGRLRPEAEAEARTIHRYRREWRRFAELPEEDAAWAGIDHPASQDWTGAKGD